MDNNKNTLTPEFVKGVVEKLSVNDERKLYFVALDKNAQTTVMEKFSYDSWLCAKEAFIFYFKSKDECIIRHIDNDFNVHKQILLDNGFVICSDCVTAANPLKISLYRGKKEICSTIINFLMIEDFCSVFDTMWNEYIYDLSMN